MLLSYCLNDLEMVQFTPVITGITSFIAFHMRSVSVVRSLILLLYVIFYFLFIQGLSIVDGCTTTK